MTAVSACAGPIQCLPLQSGYSPYIQSLYNYKSLGSPRRHDHCRRASMAEFLFCQAVLVIHVIKISSSVIIYTKALEFSRPSWSVNRCPTSHDPSGAARHQTKTLCRKIYERVKSRSPPNEKPVHQPIRLSQARSIPHSRSWPGAKRCLWSGHLGLTKPFQT